MTLLNFLIYYKFYGRLLAENDWLFISYFSFFLIGYLFLVVIFIIDDTQIKNKMCLLTAILILANIEMVETQSIL